MKTRNLLLALGCAAVLTACTTNDEPTVAPAPTMRAVTLTVDVNEPADTRVSYEKDGTTYKFAWGDTDKLSVFYYYDGVEEVTSFNINNESINGRSASFTGSLPEDYTGSVTIVYSGYYFEDIEESGTANYVRLSGYYGQTTDVAADLANRTLLAATADVTEAGVLPDVTLNHMLSYLLLKAGLQVTQAGLNVGEGDTELLLEVGAPGLISCSSTGINVVGSSGSGFGDIHVTDGKLDKDCLVPLFISGESGTSGYYVSAHFRGSEEYGEDFQPDFTYQAGKIYVVEEGNVKWVPVTVPVPEEEVTPEVGMVIGSDGKYYAAASDVPTGVTAEAMIAYLGTEAEDAPHGLAIALQDANSSTVIWDNAASAVSTWTSTHAVTGGSWRLPSADDWKYMFQGCGGDSYKADLTDEMAFSCGDFHDKLKAAGGESADVKSGYYWSSTEYDSDDAWLYYFNDGKFYWGDKMHGSYVRAALAF